MPETNETSETSGTNSVAISNQKGGAGKTTTTIHLAGALNARGYDVLAIDLDKQGGLTNSFGHDDLYYDLERDVTMYEVLENIDRSREINDLIQHGDEFDIVPSTERFMNTSNLSQLAEAGRSRERLQIAVDQIETDYDWILVDTGPDVNVLTDNAIVATGNLLIPFFPEELNKNSLRLLLKQLVSIERLYGDVNDLAMVAGRVEDNNEHESVVEEVDEQFEHPLFVVRKRTDLSKSIKQKSTIFEYETDDSHSRNVFNEIADLLEDEVR